MFLRPLATITPLKRDRLHTCFDITLKQHCSTAIKIEYYLDRNDEWRLCVYIKNKNSWLLFKLPFAAKDSQFLRTKLSLHFFCKHTKGIFSEFTQANCKFPDYFLCTLRTMCIYLPMSLLLVLKYLRCDGIMSCCWQSV